MRFLTFRPIRGIAGVGLFTLLAKTLHGQETTATSSLGIFQDDTGEQCPILGCCEYDCCGKGTSWNESIGHCVEDPDSPGFIDSSFQPSFEDGCVDRVCCEENCCQENLVFDTATSFCVPDTCSDKEFVLFVPGFGDRTMSSEDVQDMYECCSRGNEVVLNRIWESNSQEMENEEDSIQLCPGNGVAVEENVYAFTLEDDKIVVFACDNDEGQCEVSGDGLESDTGGNCRRGDDCISGVCYMGDYVRECVCSDTYGCDSNQVCLDCNEFYRQSTGAPGNPDVCGDSDTTAQYTCYLKLGEACQESGGIQCETGFCETGICVCSPVTDYPCDEETELCIDSMCQTIADGCRNEAFVLFVPYGYLEERTISSDDVQDMYDCCKNGGNVDMTRYCEDDRGSSETINLCPGNGIMKEGTVYNFTLSDDRIVTFSCNDEGECVVTGDESDTGENCCADSDCISSSCHLGDYIGGVCTCSEDYGCEENQVCLDACDDWGGEDCDRPNHVVRFKCWPPMQN